MVEQVCLVFHNEKESARSLARDILALLEQRSIKACMLEGEASAVGRPELAAPLDSCNGSDLLLVLGGDGTILRAARTLGEPPPILGINLGKFGFLSAIEPRMALEELSAILANGFEKEKRFRLAYSSKNPQSEFKGLALNDIAINRLPKNRVLNVTIEIREKGCERGSVFEFAADGLVVSSPTGSTGYALSLGGPIITPDSSSMIVMPISPHTLAQRALVLSSDYIVKVTADDECHVCADGQEHQKEERCDLEISLGAPIQTVKPDPLRYFDLLKSKIGCWRTTSS